MNQLTLNSKCMNAVAVTVPMDFTPTWKIREWALRRKAMTRATFAMCLFRLCQLGVIERAHPGAWAEYRWNRRFGQVTALVLMLALVGCVGQRAEVGSRRSEGRLLISAFRSPPPAAVVVPPVTRTVTVRWYQPGLCRGWTVLESADLKTWHPVSTWTNTAGRRDAWVTNSWTFAGTTAFWKVGSF